MQVTQVGPWERTDLAIQQHAMFYMGGTLERPATPASDQTAGLVSPASPPTSLPASRLPHPIHTTVVQFTCDWTGILPRDRTANHRGRC